MAKSKSPIVTDLLGEHVLITIGLPILAFDPTLHQAFDDIGQEALAKKIGEQPADDIRAMRALRDQEHERPGAQPSIYRYLGKLGRIRAVFMDDGELTACVDLNPEVGGGELVNFPTKWLHVHKP